MSVSRARCRLDLVRAHGNRLGPGRLFLLAAFAAALQACGQEPPVPEFRIGLLALTEGELRSSSGEPSIRGARLAEEEVRRRGGVLIAGRPYRLRLVIREYTDRTDDAATEARALINQDSIHVLVGPQLSHHAIPVALIAEDARVPMISPMSSNPQTTEGKSFVFRLAFIDDFQGEVLGRFARESLGARRGAVLYDESLAYSRGLAARFARAFTAYGGTMVAQETYTSDQSEEFSAQLRRIARARPDVLLLPNPPSDDSTQIREARRLGVTATFLGTDIWDSQRLVDVPEAQGSLVAHQWNYESTSPLSRQFLDRFRSAYGRTPRSTAAMTFDAIMLAAQAASRAGSLEPDAIRSEIASTRDFEGVTGKVSFHGTGDPDRSLVISEIAGGSISVKVVVDP